MAIRFAGERGIVLKMNNDQHDLHFFDCVGFSQFPEEDERLMFGGRWPLMVKSVLVMETAKNFSRYFGVLSIFDCVVSGGRVRGRAIPSKKDCGKLDHLIKRCLGALDEDAATFPDFVYRTFDCFRESKTEIIIHPRWLTKDYLKVFYDPILHSVAERGWDDEEDNVNMVKWDNVLSIFPNVTKVTYVANGNYYGFSLPHFLQTVSESVFSQQHTLKAIVIKNLGEEGEAAAAKLEAEKEDQSKYTVMTVAFDGSTLSVVRV